MQLPQQPTRSLTPDQLEAYRRDGVVCVRALYSPDCVAHLAKALDQIFQAGSFEFPGIGATFKSDAFSWLTNDAIRDFVLNGPTACIAQQAMESKKVNFFYDQIFIKQALTPDPTPWHHDATFWPLEGNDIVSLWTSVDPVNAESSALEFVAGSHLWDKRWKPVGAGGVVVSSEDLEYLPDINADREKYNIVSWDLEPGDALLFHARTVHGSRGNRSPNQARRAITTRWCGDDVVFRPIEGQMPIVWAHGLKPGEHLGGPIFPQILPTIDNTAIAARMDGPVLPVPELAMQAMMQLGNAERVPVKMDF